MILRSNITQSFEFVCRRALRQRGTNSFPSFWTSRCARHRHHHTIGPRMEAIRESLADMYRDLRTSSTLGRLRLCGVQHKHIGKVTVRNKRSNGSQTSALANLSQPSSQFLGLCPANPQHAHHGSSLLFAPQRAVDHPTILVGRQPSRFVVNL